MAITNKALKARVRRGIEILNKALGLEWRQQVDLDDLDMSRGTYVGGGCGCVLAQLDWRLNVEPDREGWEEGSYSHMANDVLGLREDDGAQDEEILAGFYTNKSSDYRKLTEFWKAELS